MALLAAGCSSASDGSKSGSKITGGAPPPAAIVGSWYAGAGYTSMPYDPATGTFGTPTGQGLVYVLRADGSYTKAYQSYVSNGGCTTGMSAFESGTISVNGDRLETDPTSGSTHFSDSCAPSLDSDKPAESLAPETFTFTLEGSELVLVRSDGVTGRFRPLAQ
ncbi:MAG: hypothetical protein ACXVEF_40360 [Polyangiales bacterium]